MLLSPRALNAPPKKSAEAGGTGAPSARARELSAVPGPLHGGPLLGSTGLRLLVSADPPFVLNVDTGAIRPVAGLEANGNPVLTILPVGQDAVVWLDRGARSGGFPRAEIYLVRHGTTQATRIATGWEVAPADGGHAIWLLSFKDTRHCTLTKIGLDGRTRQRARPVSCSVQLIDAGFGAVLVHSRTVVDPATGRTLLSGGSLWAIAGGRALTSTGSGPPPTPVDPRTRPPPPPIVGGGGGLAGSVAPISQAPTKLSFSREVG